MGGDQQHSYSLKVFIAFVALGLPFPQVHLSVGGGGGGEGGGQQASSLSSKHKLWNFHRFWLVCIIISSPGVIPFLSDSDVNRANCCVEN